MLLELLHNSQKVLRLLLLGSIFRQGLLLWQLHSWQATSCCCCCCWSALLDANSIISLALAW
jgi:hypothetical protein